jgi:hypothetical protein
MDNGQINGFNSNIYILKYNNIKYILKRQKILQTEIKKNLKFKIWKEIEFSEFVNKLPKYKQVYFMKMIKYEIIICPIYEKYENIKIDKKLYDSKWCLDIMYEYKNKTCYNLLKKNYLPLQEKYSFIIQILYALNIMKKNGYKHNDLHPYNITYIRTKSPIIIGKNKINSTYQYSLIDYGLVTHVKHPKNSYESNSEQLILFIWSLCRVNTITDIYRENKWKISKTVSDPYGIDIIFMKMFDNKDIWNKVKENILYLYPNYINFYIFFEKDLNYKKSSDFFFSNTDINHLIIQMLYMVYDKIDYYKILGLTKVKSYNYIPVKDISFMIFNISNYQKIINYFINKM